MSDVTVRFAPVPPAGTCPACPEKRLHTAEDWQFHPYRTHGFVSGHGWTHPDLEPPAAAGREEKTQS